MFEVFLIVNLKLDDDKFIVITGPNGSGKSNIVDAVRWVLGEQSVKALRGDGSMTDVIFAGSKTRGPQSRASVSLVFDNSDHYLNSEFNELDIKRVVYKTGENEYYINNTKVRLKDITNLLNTRLLEFNMKADSVRIEDISYSTAYEQAIERKQIAQQEALAEKNRTELIKQKAEQELIKTKAEAEALKIRAKAEAESIRDKVKSLTQSKDLIEYEKAQVYRLQAEKWDGKLPNAVYNGSPLPVLNIEK